MDIPSNIYSQDELKTRRFSGSSNHNVCRDWLSGVCSYGASCNFAHHYRIDSMPICKWQVNQSFCLYGQWGTCLFKHDVSTGAFWSQRRAAKAAKSQQPCVRYLMGYCAAGSTCPNVHKQLPASKLPKEPRPDWYINSVLSTPVSRPDQSKDASLKASAFWREFATSVNAVPRSKRFWSQHGLISSILDSAASSEHDSYARSQSDYTPVLLVSDHFSNLLLSVQCGIWGMPNYLAKQFNVLLDSGRTAFVFFGSSDTDGLLGFGKVMTSFDYTLSCKEWLCAKNSAVQFCRVRWLKQTFAAFEKMQQCLPNSYLPVVLKKARVYKELQMDSANMLCGFLNELPAKELTQGTELADKPRIDHNCHFLKPVKDLAEEETRLSIASL